MRNIDPECSERLSELGLEGSTGSSSDGRVKGRMMVNLEP